MNGHTLDRKSPRKKRHQAHKNLTAKGGFEIQLWAQLLCRNGREQFPLASACCHTKSQRGRERFIPYKNSEFLGWKVILAMKHQLQCQWFFPSLSTISSPPLVHEHKASKGRVLQSASPSSRCWEILPFLLCLERGMGHPILTPAGIKLAPRRRSGVQP